MIDFRLPNGSYANSDLVGFLPDIISPEDPRPAAVQIAENYVGGWRPLPDCTLRADNSFSYPGDPISRPLCSATLREELIVLYRYGFLAIIQPDRSFEISRVD